MDNDNQYPGYVGTGAGDYIGRAWGLGTFNNLYQGCTVASEAKREFEFYKFDIPDPIYFSKNIRVTWQRIGGADSKLIRQLLENGVKLKRVTVDGTVFSRLLDMELSPVLIDKNFPEGLVNFYRIDDYAVTSYFYPDKPFTGVTELALLNTRLQKVK
ncbi:hypothetical protein BH10BAC3_BH10BAC3_24550 [soil metagenome]